MTTIADVLEGRSQWAVVHGDCLEVLPELPDKCGVVVTDVPYSVKKPIDNDDLPWDQYLPWLDGRLAECCRVGRRVFSFYGSTRAIRFIRETTVPPTYPLHWHKPFLLHGRSLNGSPFLAHGEQIFYWGPSSAKEAGKRGYDSFAFDSMWPRERKTEGIEHPTPKSVPMLVAALRYWADEGELVVDPFVGSGTVMIAALRLGHRCIGIDTDPRWVEECRRRLEEELVQSTLGAAKRGQRSLFESGT